jgi:hypothetical protein
MCQTRLPPPPALEHCQLILSLVSPHSWRLKVTRPAAAAAAAAGGQINAKVVVYGGGHQMHGVERREGICSLNLPIASRKKSFCLMSLLVFCPRLWRAFFWDIYPVRVFVCFLLFLRD